MNKYVVFHGHFYQPPRENPWTGLIPNQPSAEPFHDWNERILSECYQANGASRYLNTNGQVIKINNNYEKMSFNFGPTLLTWIKQYHPFVYKKIIDADKKSQKDFNGHGNAIAQVYNHIIMPLADEKDKRTQIEWGISDFENHFSRKPEGLWLAETAIDTKTIDLLIEYNIKFIILSPWQCHSIKAENSKEWTEIKGAQNVSTRAYKLKGTNGYLSAFFYDPILAHGISFEHYLQDADKLYQELIKKAENSETNLIHCATDGEVFGHHEPFGDMCYSALTEKIKGNPKLILTNYGQYLENHPAVDEAILHKGEKNLGSSWSCSHGVSRWYKDCGCSTGGQEGWNQKWRKPLRDAFDQLKETIRDYYYSQIKKITKHDPEKIWNNYIQVINNAESKINFANRYGIKEETKNYRLFYHVLESRKFTMYMYTSCGWFFAELSGIEPVQNICYALRAIELCDENSDSIKKNFLNLLSKAKSNLYDQGTGLDIAIRAEKKFKKTEEHVAAELITKTIAKIGLNPKKILKDYSTLLINQNGNYSLTNLKFSEKNNFSKGLCIIQKEISKEKKIFHFQIKTNEKQQTIFHFSTKKDEIKILASEIEIDSLSKYKMSLALLSNWNKNDQEFNQMLLLVKDVATSHFFKSDKENSFYSSLINLKISQLIDTAIKKNEKITLFSKKIKPLLSIINRTDCQLNQQTEKTFSDFITFEVSKLSNQKLKLDQANRIILLLKILHQYNINIDITDAQSIMWEFYKKTKEFNINPKNDKISSKLNEIYQLLNINIGEALI